LCTTYINPVSSKDISLRELQERLQSDPNISKIEFEVVIS
jgi:hypothetical protein